MTGCAFHRSVIESSGLKCWRNRGASLMLCIVLAAVTCPIYSRSWVSPAAKPISIRVLPENPTLYGTGASQSFLVLARYDDRLEREVTAQSVFSVSDDKIAEVDERGKVRALVPGQAVLSAQFGSYVVKTTFRIEGSTEPRPFIFGWDVGGIFTRHGCNRSECHGGVKGRGGFKLSFNGLHPKKDYRWIVEGGTYQVLTEEASGPRNPRVDLAEPARSLLLLKPTMNVPHGGGQRFDTSSRDYETLLRWIEDGAAYGGEGVHVENLEIFPQQLVLDAQGEHQLLVTARLPNGRRVDVSDDIAYKSQDPNIADVSKTGRVEGKAPGETAVIVRAPGHAVSVRVGVIAKPVPSYPDVHRRNFIDEHVFVKLRDFHIVPSALSSDDEFLRRICLDLTGTLPPPNRVRDFLASQDPQKRDQLIETLLDSAEYVNYWSYRLGKYFRVTMSGAGTQDEAYTQLYAQWIRDSIAQNKPYDQIARERIAAQGYDAPSWSHYQFGGNLRSPQDIMTEEVRAFLGLRLDCAQCHDHPYETWSQDQFWGMAAFFGRLTYVGERTGVRLPTRLTLDDAAGNGRRKEPGVLNPRTQQEVEPKFLDGKPFQLELRTNLRMRLAEWMTSPKNPQFAPAIVNRIWGHFFARGIVDPVADFRVTNPPTHPELLEALAEDFIQHGYDLKHLIREIVQSRTYQLSGAANETNRDDNLNYSRSLPRPLEPAVILDVISQVTGVEPDFSLIHCACSSASQMRAAPLGMRAIDVFPGLFPSRFLEVFGQHKRVSIPEGKPQPTLTQALHMVAGPTYTTNLAKEGERVDRLLKDGATNRHVMEELYLAALSRFPTRQEQVELERLIALRPSRADAIESLTWAIISSREFTHNH